MTVLALDVEKRLGDFTLAAKFAAAEGATALFGPSGAGKSTIVNLIAGLRVPLGGLAKDLTGLCIEGGVQGQCAMPVVLKAVPLGAPGRQRQHRVLAVQRLNGRLLIDAEHRGMLRRP